MAYTVSDLITGALAELRVARAGDVLAAEQLTYGLQVLNELLDAWNADDHALYNVQFSTFTLTANHQPHTIGLSANTPDFAVSVGRPRAILRANLILANNIRVPFERLNGQPGILDDEEWASIRAGAATGQSETISSAVPRHLYYSPDWPNGNIYLWPWANTAYGLELETTTLLAQVATTDTLSLPFGYQQALRLTLAERLAPGFGQTVDPATKQAALDARNRAFAQNATLPNLVTRDGGMPAARGARFNYLTGFVE